MADYSTIIAQIGDIISYCLPISILLGLIDRLMEMIIRAATGKGD